MSAINDMLPGLVRAASLADAQVLADLEQGKQRLSSYCQPRAYTHRRYDVMLPVWELLRQSYQGGDEYIAHHLFPHPKESPKLYARRLQRAVARNHCQTIVDTYSAQLYRAPVGREGPSGARAVLEPYWQDVTLTGQPADDFWREVADWAQVYGALAIVTDRHEPAGEPLTTRADERTAGRRPYSYWVPPQDLVDWQVDRRGDFVWAMIRERHDREREYSALHEEPDELYRRWTREGWALYRVHDLKQEEQSTGAQSDRRRYRYELLDEGTHPVGRVPIDMVWVGKRIGREPVAHSPLADIAPHQRRLLNLDSLVDEQLYQYVFSLLCVGERTFERLASIEWSVAGCLPVYQEEKAPFYLAPDVTQIAALRSEAEKAEASIRFLSGIGRQNEQSRAAQSGLSLAYQTADKRALIEDLGEVMSEGEVRCWRTALAWMEVRAEELVPPRYQVEIGPGEIEADLQAALAFASLGVTGEAAIENALQAARSRFGSAVPPERLEAILEDIRNRLGQPAPS